MGLLELLYSIMFRYLALYSLLSVSVTVAHLSAQTSEDSIPEPFYVLPLWDTVMPGNNGAEGPEVRNNCGVTNVSMPTLSVYLPESPNSLAILFTPGGGYGNVCLNAEGPPQVAGLLRQGITAFVLKYRLPNGNRDVPIWDGRRALQLIRANAERWKIDANRIGVWGYSAGGHLSSSLSNGVGSPYPAPRDLVSKERDRPDFAILFYPVISMEDAIAHKGSRRNLLGTDEPTQTEIRAYSTHLRVTPKTPPTFTIHSEDDHVVSVANAIAYDERLQQAGVSSELHLYETGGHGPSVMNTNPEWENALNEWLSKR